jgi:hypothetical protein
VNAFPTVNSNDASNLNDLHNLQKHQFKLIFSRLKDDIPLVCLCGNHDVGERPTPDTLAGWRNSFGKDYFKFNVNIYQLDVSIICFNKGAVNYISKSKLLHMRCRTVFFFLLSLSHPLTSLNCF